MADQIRVHCDRPVDVTPFGVDCEQFRPSRVDPMTNNEFVVGIVKGLEPIYGVEHLIRGFAMASKRSRRKMRLIIAGDGSLRKSLEALTHEVGISNQATFLGLISHKDVPTILNQFSVFVAPSIGPESFGVAVIEASACAVPVIVSSIGGLPEVVREGETGLLVPPRDASAIAAALEKLMQDESLRVGLGKEGRKFVLNNYEWSENAARMERVYDTLIN
jgi:glycosyltransferase involved in cell wall biosynthesis